MQAVTYLAMEMSLYLASAAFIGIVLGWLVWGQGRRRHTAKIRAEMATSVEAERNIAAKAHEALDELEAKQVRLLEAEKVSSAKALAELRQMLETEKKGSHSARAEMGQLRLAMGEAIDAEKTSASIAIQEAMRNAENLTIAAREAEMRETQTRSESEELRLMIGAEKLAAQSARSELSRVRQEMQQALDVEREESAQARKALNDIQTTLARTFGQEVKVATAVNTTPPEAPVSETDDQLELIKTDVQVFDDDPYDEIDAFNESVEAASFDAPRDSTGINVEPGVAFNVQDEDGTPIQEADVREKSAELENMAVESDGDEPLLSAIEDGQDNVSNVETLKPTLDLEPLNLSNDQDVSSDELDVSMKPISFFDERPEEVDELQAIEGIDSEIERVLNDHGCYQFIQLAHFTDHDIDWLCQAAKDVTDLKERIVGGGWIQQARDLQEKKYSDGGEAKSRWWNRRRLQ